MGFALPARPPWGYGLLCGAAVSGPLFAGVTAGVPHGGAFVALGAYLTAFGDMYGKPYAQRAWNLVAKLVLVPSGMALGMLVAPYPWWGAVAIGLVAAAARWRIVGTPPAIAAVLGFYLHAPVGPSGPLEMALGAVWFSVLALAPWPVRRLDPLHEALSGARESLASMLDGVDLDDEGWGKRRERASKALEAAGTASAAFHAGEDNTRSADAYVRTLVRVFVETVTLRGLRAQAAEEDRRRGDRVMRGLGQEDPRGGDDVARARPDVGRGGGDEVTPLLGDRDRRGGEEVVRALAVGDRCGIDAVVRALTVALRTKTPQDVEAALAAAAAFGEYVGEQRARIGADPASLRRMAVLGQVRRCLDRIVVGVRGVGVFAARGIRVPAVVPRAWRPVVWRPIWRGGHGWWRPARLRRAWRRAARVPRRAWRALRAEGTAEHPGRLGIAVTAAMTLMIGTHEVYGKWFVITVMLALRSTYGDTVERVVLRVAGTVLGAAVAAVVLAAVPGPYTIAATVLGFATVGYALREVSYAYWMVFATPLAMMLADFSTPLDWRAAGVRVLLTVGGGLLALAAARLLWPRSERRRLRTRTAELLEQHGAMVEAVGERDLHTVVEHAEAAGQAADAVTATLDKLDKEPGGQVPRELREAVTAARRLRDDALAVASVLRGSEVGSDATVAVLDAVADRLAAVAETVRSGEPPPEADELEERLTELAGEVTSIIKEAVAREAAKEAAAKEHIPQEKGHAPREEAATPSHAVDTSAVRRQLRLTVTAHPALRSLCSDALELAREAAAPLGRRVSG
ncbi:FUSC family protein [Nonomuraea sp. SMC257]|uniref:FUSC family protein n=1 Tax=Nonomuraea montanisoli TaxID=2741721 RepID=A0A7Y6M4T7_9ACTN|nr:FUSC family protein [Nonomuraea montanisoli]NUW33604.1 FUSC family protein [Nonomuraea montanisoli]